MTHDDLVELLLNYFKENEGDYILSIEELDGWNGYLGDARIDPMYSLSDYFFDDDVQQIMERALSSEDISGGNFNIHREYFFRDDFGNFISTDTVDYSYWLDSYFVRSLVNVWIKQHKQGSHNLYLPETVENMILNYLENAEDDNDTFYV